MKPVTVVVTLTHALNSHQRHYQYSPESDMITSAHMRAHTHTHTHIYIHIYIHTHIYILLNIQRAMKKC